MRFTQFGHQVPRRNSRISVPEAIRPLRVNVPSRLAAPREKFGALDPMSRVSVRLFMLTSTLSEVEIRNNNGWGTGIIFRSPGGERCGSCPGTSFAMPKREPPGFAVRETPRLHSMIAPDLQGRN